jgi:hypothetical protein
MNQYGDNLNEEVITAGAEDAEGMAALNDAIYPKEWHVPPAYLKEIMMRNPEVYRIIKTSAGVKGIYGLFPLSKAHYSAVLAGKLEEDEVGKYILDYDEPKAVYLYFITLIVDIRDAERKQYASRLIKDIPLELRRLKEKGIDILEVGCFAVSSEGEKVAPKIGFVHSGETAMLNKEYPVYRAKPEQIFANIKS